MARPEESGAEGSEPVAGPPGSDLVGPAPSDDVVEALFARHGIRGSWAILTRTGIANFIYATRDVVLRVATDHPEGVCDARTESVAAPVARRAGLRVPRLLAFDDSRELIDRPYSLWERVHGETVGLFAPDPASVPDTWREVGRELARLHDRVRECPDPNGWLDEPGSERDSRERLIERVGSSPLETATATELERWIAALSPRIEVETATCFLHDDVHAMNLMCARDGTLLAVLDWGDAGWGDPVGEFACMPMGAVEAALAGYREVAPELLGEDPEARILWDRLERGLGDLAEDPTDRGVLVELLGFVGRAGPDWGAR